MRKAMAESIFVLALGLLVAAAPVHAHHGFSATYDSTKPLEVHCEITKVELINPHSWFWCDEKSAEGAVINWGFEGGSPSVLIRHGVTKNSIPLGTKLIIQGYRSKAFEHQGVAIKMIFPDGRNFLLGAPGGAPGTEGDAAPPSK